MLFHILYLKKFYWSHWLTIAPECPSQWAGPSHRSAFEAGHCAGFSFSHLAAIQILAIYTLSSVALNFKASNLTNR
jgi:hypothetical protein